MTAIDKQAAIAALRTRREDIPRGGERLLSVVADLCRRELARGER